ncbi:MAG: hypothetical protein QM800_12800 [Paludibacter sp.]
MSKTIYCNTAPLGETITYEFRSLFGYKFLKMRINFDVVKHLNFARVYMQSIQGIGLIISIDTRGYLFFSLTGVSDEKTMIAGIEKEFNTYFSTLDKNPIQ